MSNSIRVRTSTNGSDKYLKVNVDQEFDFIEILSLNLAQEDVYRQFCSDYGVVVGRVIINSGFGVPNAKVSIFVPIDAVDKGSVLLSGLYPFETVSDKDSNGVRYNVLQQESQSQNDCFTPIGTFPTKRQVLDNDVMLDIYCKYYKFTTTTNHAGDFMIFGVPIGTYTLHVDADISDIGIASQRPYDLISQGTPEKMFYSPTKFMGGTNLDKLIQVKTANVGVNVQPFWGDTNNCQIGITRADIDLNYVIQPSAIFMGSLFGDQHKHSINTRCRPRAKFGEMCDQVTGPGSISMIRQTIDGQIEEFDVEGGRVIDDDGTWAYQIPMNLDYMVTDEYGDLILSSDPNIGIPTRANVRFKISMDETGGEGRLRTRANYLVPNNPQNQNEIDYNFDQTTLDSSFKDLYWNKIYTVSNFISRFQGDNEVFKTKIRAMTGIKNVDACDGDKTPFPYNKVNTQGNPIFFIICLLVKVVGFIIFLINFFLIPIINGIVHLINDIVNFVNKLGAHLSDVAYVPCITVNCDTDEGPVVFAPGCDNTDGRLAANPQPSYYCNDPAQHNCGTTPLVGWDDCIAFELAKSLDLFEFDFYNDWINGTLFNFLLKYKKRRKGREVFCEYDCSDFVSDPNYSGVDGNNNGVPDNDCYNHLLLDTCYPNANFTGNDCSDCQDQYFETGVLREGLIKQYNGDLYYAATTHNAGLKLFATDIKCLGSVFDCDWQGFPNLQPYLIPTTYKLPPDVQEEYIDASGNTITLASGMVGIGGNTIGEFFNVDCIGLHTNSTQCLNLRHICEMGVDIDQLVEDPQTGAVISAPDGIIGSNDIDSDVGKEFRDSFIGLNSGTTSVSSFNIGTGLTSDFNVANCARYDFTTDAAINCTNGVDYVNFRGYTSGSITSYGQTEDSFYMYFGILPGKTALDKMNRKFFTKCTPQVLDDVILQTSAVPDSSNTSVGSVTFTFIGGQGPYSYNVTGPNSYTNSGSGTTETLSNLAAGIYTISGFDSLGTPVTQTVVVSGPIPFYCSAIVTQNVTSTQSNDGEITVTFGGGRPSYVVIISDPVNNFLTGTTASTAIPIVFGGLGVDALSGYTVSVTDSLGNTCITSGLTLSGPSTIQVSTTPTDVVCYNGSDGTIQVNVNGGTPPYTVKTTGIGYVGNSLYLTALQAGIYTTTVVDSLGTTGNTVVTTIISQAPQLTLSVSSLLIRRQCDPNNYTVSFNVTSGLANGATAYIQYSIDGGGLITTQQTFINSSTPIVLTFPKASITSSIVISFSNTANFACYSNVATINVTDMVLPTASLAGSISVSGSSRTINTPTGGIAPYSASPYTIGQVVTSSTAITTTITDSVGCTVQITG